MIHCGQFGLAENGFVDDVQALADLANGVEQRVWGDVLGIEGRSACPDGVQDLIVVVVGREHNDGDIGLVVFELACNLHAVHRGQVDVQQDDVGRQVRRCL